VAKKEFGAKLEKTTHISKTTEALKRARDELLKTDAILPNSNNQ